MRSRDALRLPAAHVRELTERADASATFGRLAGAVDIGAPRAELHVELVALAVLRARQAAERRTARP